MGNQNGNNQNGNNGGNNTGNQPEKKGLAGMADKAQRKLDALSNSKAWRWGKRILTGAALALTGKVCYDKGVAKGKASVVPTVVTIEKLPETETPAETPAEESATEETV